MYKFKRANCAADYKGFRLKPGFWYGVNEDSGNPIATSGWELNGSLAMYELVDGKWQMKWVEIEGENFKIEDISISEYHKPKEGKMSFRKWLKSEYGVTWEYFDNNFTGDEEFREYKKYLYDDLPEFAIKCVESAEKSNE